MAKRIYKTQKSKGKLIVIRVGQPADAEIFNRVAKRTRVGELIVFNETTLERIDARTYSSKFSRFAKQLELF